MVKRGIKTPNTRVRSASREALVWYHSVKQERGGVEKVVSPPRPWYSFDPHAPVEGYPNPAHGMFRIA